MFHWLRMWRARRAFRRFDANHEEAERTVVKGHLYTYDDEALPTVVRRWAAAHYFSRFSLNDGFAQPARREELLGLAVAGMRAAGADQCAAIVERAAALLNAQRVEWNDPRVRELEEEFFKLTDALEVKLILYAAEYHDEFHRAEARQAAQEAAEAQKRGAN